MTLNEQIKQTKSRLFSRSLNEYRMLKKHFTLKMASVL